MSEEKEQAVNDAARLLFDCMYELQRTVMQDWQSLNMSMAQVKVLMTLNFKGPASISKLAEALGVSHPTASQLVDRLVHAGLVERVESSIDRRFTLARLNKSGALLAQRLWQGRMDNLRYCLARLDEPDLTALQQGVRALNNITASRPTEPPEGDRPTK